MDAQIQIHGHHFSHNELELVNRYKERTRLTYGAILTVIMMIVELLGGLYTGSLALIGDAGHMFTHFLALSVALVAIYLGGQPPSDSCSYGYFRIEILGAFFNGIFVIGTSIFIMYEAIQRLFSPVAIAASEMLIIGGVGLVVNLATAYILHEVSEEDLNVRGAYIHMIGDTSSSIAVMIAAMVILFTGLVIVDIIASFFVAIVILVWGVGLIRDSSHILLQGTPQTISVEKLVESLRHEFPEIIDIHDVHVWVLTSGILYMTAHMVIQNCQIYDTHNLIDQINRHLDANCGISHTTFQIESSSFFNQ
jgi:cobalt-zinc-cadmium efflux system protein